MMKSYQAGKFFCRRIDINDSALFVYREKARGRLVDDGEIIFFLGSDFNFRVSEKFIQPVQSRKNFINSLVPGFFWIFSVVSSFSIPSRNEAIHLFIRLK